MKHKVSVLRCTGYNKDEIKKVLQESIQNLGGLSNYVSAGERVLLKINLLTKRKPEEAVTTHPAFVQALAELFMENGNKVLIGDSPGGLFNEKILTSIYKVTGMKDIAEQSGAELNYNVNSMTRDNPRGALLKTLTVTSMLDDVDKVISVSKLKTHQMMIFTGAVKNMFGIIPGVMKAEYHLNMKEYKTFAAALVDICLCANPVLSFMDGIEAMEGAGPSAGTVRKLDAVIASASPYHLDKTACVLIGLDGKKVPVLLDCMQRGLCAEDFSDIELTGIALSELMVDDFVIPENSGISARWGSSSILTGLANTFVQPKPVFDQEKCTACGICAANCPTKVISMQNDKPQVALRSCIRCYCCHELCPEKAITIFRPALLRHLT